MACMKAHDHLESKGYAYDSLHTTAPHFTAITNLHSNHESSLQIKTQDTRAASDRTTGTAGSERGVTLRRNLIQRRLLGLVKATRLDRGGAFTSHMAKKLRPNFFVSLRITNDSIIENIRNLQSEALLRFPKLKTCAIAIPTLHITLSLLHLTEKHEVEKAVRVLEDAKGFLRGHSDTYPYLSFSGIGVFGKNRVVFTSPKEDDNCDIVSATALTSLFPMNSFGWKCSCGTSVNP